MRVCHQFMVHPFFLAFSCPLWETATTPKFLGSFNQKERVYEYPLFLILYVSNID